MQTRKSLTNMNLDVDKDKHGDSLADRQRLWLMSHALSAFNTVTEAGSHIIANDLKYGDALFYPLFTSLVVNYARSGWRQLEFSSDNYWFVGGLG